jgi:hypothetical protein
MDLSVSKLPDAGNSNGDSKSEEGGSSPSSPSASPASPDSKAFKYSIDSILHGHPAVKMAAASLYSDPRWQLYQSQLQLQYQKQLFLQHQYYLQHQHQVQRYHHNHHLHHHQQHQHHPQKARQLEDEKRSPFSESSSCKGENTSPSPPTEDMNRVSQSVKLEQDLGDDNKHPVCKTETGDCDSDVDVAGEVDDAPVGSNSPPHRWQEEEDGGGEGEQTRDTADDSLDKEDLEMVDHGHAEKQGN